MKLKEITFVLENCDWITIPGHYVGSFIVDDIRTYIARIACNSINRVDEAGFFAIEIHRNANVDYHEFGQKDYEGFKRKKFNRLTSCSDITQIQFDLIQDYVEEGQVPRQEHYEYAMPWTGESDYNNESQKVYVSDEGHLYIVISEDKDVFDIFDKEEINDSEYIGFHFQMLDVGVKSVEETEN